MPDSYTLPDLPYDPVALEPYISGRIMELHHHKHHAAYVKGANTAPAKLEEIRDKNDFSAISKLEKNLACNVSGHVLHSLFWTNLSPSGGREPVGDLAEVIDAAVAGSPRADSWRSPRHPSTRNWRVAACDGRTVEPAPLPRRSTP
jgi:superoxide dismutase, Fe-Mn family